MKGGSPDGDGIAGSMMVMNPTFDGEGVWFLREVDAVRREHVADFLSARTHRCQFVFFALDKVAGARGNRLQHGFAVLQSNVAFELVPQVLV